MNTTKDSGKVRLGNAKTPAALKDSKKVKMGGGFIPALLNTKR